MTRPGERPHPTREDCTVMIRRRPSAPVLLAIGMVLAWHAAGPRASARGQEAATPRRPNILFLFTDDQRADTIHALGNPAIRTPNLDRLAGSGFVFRNAYCSGGNIPAVCLPSRTMLMSGRSLFHLKAATADAPSLPRSFNDAGYVTYHHGKRGNTPQAIQANFRVNKYLKNDQEERSSGYPGREIADEAVAFLKDRPRDRPFLMYLAFANPHDPRVVNREERARYDEPTMPLPANYRPFHPFDNGELFVRDEQLAPWPRTPEVVRSHLTDYYGVITSLDRQLGRILALIDDNTIVVVSSDHGLAIGSHGLFGKQNIYEDGMKVPLIVSGPGIKPGRSDAFVYLYDLLPTLCSLAGIAVPGGIDGRDLAPVIRGETDAVRDSVFLAYRDVQRAVRRADWKLIRYPQIDRSQLFNLKNDPAETNDLSKDPAHAGKLAELTARLADEQRRHDDTLELTVTNPKPADIDESFFRNPPPAQPRAKAKVQGKSKAATRPEGGVKD
jgi:arylsulfatase A-like enzyme